MLMLQIDWTVLALEKIEFVLRLPIPVRQQVLAEWKLATRRPLIIVPPLTNRPPYQIPPRAAR